jgi:low affinity Fe/Cu permease
VYYTRRKNSLIVIKSKKEEKIKKSNAILEKEIVKYKI